MARDAPSWDQRNTYCPIDARSGITDVKKRFDEISGLRIVGELLLSSRKHFSFSE